MAKRARGPEQALETTLDTIHKRFGDGAIMKLGDRQGLDVPVIPTTSMSVDYALGVGGVPRGRAIEIFGPESSGKTTLALHLVAEAQRLGDTALAAAAEEALAAVPGSMREGSYACGASKWQTIRRIVLPRAMPGIMTGTILAMARGAGEVAPLMLVGAVKLAPMLPVDGVFPYIHPERSFMHLGFHIYDVGFQSPNVEAVKPLVFATALLLVLVVLGMNIAAILIRNRLRAKYTVSAI